jgi:hypothetical protein
MEDRTLLESVPVADAAAASARTLARELLMVLKFSGEERLTWAA